MWLFIFVGTFVCASVCGDAGIGAVFRKCCPKDQSLVKVSDFNLTSVIYECLTREDVEQQYDVSHSPLIIGDTVSVDYGMPKFCDGLDIFQLSPEDVDTYSSSEHDSCYDRVVAGVVNGTVQHVIPRVVTLTCIYNETEDSTGPNLKIDQIRKCCPKGQSYDTINHICRINNDNISEQWLVNHFNASSDFIYEVVYGLHCKYVEFGVELSEDLFELALQGSSLKTLNKIGELIGVASQGEWCVDKEYKKSGLVARVCTQNCSGYEAFCLRKCCPVGQHFRVRSCDSPISRCVSNDEEIPFETSVYLNHLKGRVNTDILGIRTELRCPNGKVMLNRSLERDYHQLMPQGTLQSAVANDDGYCFETFDNRHCPEGGLDISALICFVKSPVTKNFKISVVLITISSVCLALTLIVYISLPELRNLHGKTLICHVSTMLVAFSCLARVQYSEVRSNRMCIALGYGIYFGFTAAFAWLNVMCFDIWSTFGSMRTVQTMRKTDSEWRRFIWYSMYAWSVAVVLTVTMFLLDQFPVAHFLDANIGNGMCWFGTVQNTKYDWPHYIFFVIPMGLITCTNFGLFMLTARHCARVKSEVHRLQAGSVGDRAKRRFRVDRAKYVLTGKLWVVMGAGWVAELLSTLASDPQWLWSIVDLFNELQGVFIFLILVFKPKLYYLIRKRLGLEKPDAQKPASGRTSSTFLSRTISSDERATLRISQNNAIKQA